MDMNPTFRNLTAEADFAASVLHDSWRRKEEKYAIPHFQFRVSCSENSTSSIGSISSSDLSDDALSPLSSSSSSSFSTSSRTSPSTTQELPIKKGLSKYYQGKSQTFTSLSDVKCIEDLAKRENNYRKKEPRTSLSPKAIISKKTATARSSFSSLVSKADS